GLLRRDGRRTAGNPPRARDRMRPAAKPSRNSTLRRSQPGVDTLNWPLIGSCVVGGGVFLAAVCAWFYSYLRRTYLDVIVRCFEEPPLFIVPRGQPLSAGELVR